MIGSTRPSETGHRLASSLTPTRSASGRSMQGRSGTGVRSIQGIRYEYGDLDDVVNLLYEHPFTRQATFPIFFPEDTGAVHGGRIPCTLHYHFLRRGDSLHLWYAIRSCDAVRHFRDDVYMATRLCQWVTERSFVQRSLVTIRPL
jgi:thymidylate synthase